MLAFEVKLCLKPLARALEQLMHRYSVPTAYIDGQIVARLASDELVVASPSLLSEDVLLNCIANIDQVAHLIGLPGRRYTHKELGKDAAAITIQKTYRMWLDRRYVDDTFFDCVFNCSATQSLR